MIKKIKVKHQHRYTLEEASLYQGEATFNVYDDYEEYIYKEGDDSLVQVCVYDTYMTIMRKGEVHSHLKFLPEEKTNNLLKSAYGDFEVEIFTYNYQHDDHNICVEYDIVSSEQEKDGYKIVFEVKEDIHEFN